MLKKTVSVLLVFSVIFSFSSCSREKRIDFFELLLRMRKSLPGYTINENNAFFSDGKWFLYIENAEKSQFLLTAEQNENLILNVVSLTVCDFGEKNIKQSFLEVLRVLADSFCFETDVNELLKNANVNENTLFGDDVCFSEIGRFSLSFFNADMGSSVVLKIT